MKVFRSERGSAALEFLAAGVVLLVPLVYLVLTLGRIQSAQLASESAVRHAARIFVTAQNPVAAERQATTAMTDALADVNIPLSRARTTLTCSPTPTNCLAPGSWVRAQMRVSVYLPFIPPVFHLDEYARVVVTAEATQRVSL